MITTTLPQSNVTTLSTDTSSTQLTSAHVQHVPLCQLAALETEFMEQIHELQKRKRVHGTALTLDEIIEYVTQEMQDTNNNDELEDDEVEDTKKQITKPSEALDLCAHMEWLCLEYSASDIPVLGLQSQLRKLQGHFRRLDNQSQVQAPLDHFWTVTSDV